jgi:1-acyl-sn-glycerol-3-phosphate acyltransferase
MSLPILLHAALETARISVPTVVDAKLHRLNAENCDLRLRSWSSQLLKRVDARVRVLGLPRLEGFPGPFVVVSNHQSHYDIPVLYSVLPLSLRMAAKSELFKTPLWGSALKESGFVEVDRSSPKAALRALRKAGEAMHHHQLSLFVAPEGTRSTDGTLGEFKRGAFDVARFSKVPVLPVAISGTLNIHKKGSKQVHRGVPVTVTILDPILPEDFPKGNELGEQVRQRILAALNEI